MLNATRYSVIVYALIISIVSGAMLPIVASAGESNRVLLCTSNGYEWVELGDSTNSDVEHKHCVYCYLSDDEPYVYDDLVLTAEFARCDSGNGFGQINFVFTSSQLALAQARAPPIFL